MVKKKYKFKNVAVRLVKERPIYSDYRISTCKDAVNAVSQMIGLSDKEMLCVISTQTDGRPVNFNVASIGSRSMALFNNGDIIKVALLSNATGIIVMHNHPSGSLEPSKDDIEGTKKLKEACELVNIRLLDHVIASPDGKMFSLYEHNLI